MTREAGRRRLRILLVGVCAFVLVGSAYLIVESPFLDVDHVRVAGGVHTRTAAVERAARIPHDAALLRVDTAAIARRVERLPWVERATVTRAWPGTVRIAISEYQPAAYVRVAGAVALVADDGHVVARVPRAPSRLVEVTGLQRAPKVGELLSPPDAPSALETLPARLRAEVTAVDLGGPGVALTLARGGEVRFGNLDQLEQKAAAALAVLDSLGARPFAYIDVRVPSAPVAGGVADD